LAWTADGTPAQFSFHRRLVWQDGLRNITQKLSLH
jgi:hypothetical protein